jgi:Zn ribbon nucleic-acid-binding protein
LDQVGFDSVLFGKVINSKNNMALGTSMPEKDRQYPSAICPNCESTDVIAVDEPHYMLKCKKCGFFADREMFWTRSDR